MTTAQAFIKEEFLRVEGVVLFGDAKPTYFVDIVSIMSDGEKSTGGVYSSRYLDRALKYAFEMSNKMGCRVIDEASPELSA